MKYDLTQYSKHIARLDAEMIEESGAAYVESIKGKLENDLQVLADEGCLLTNEEFDAHEKAGTLPNGLMVGSVPLE